MLAAWAVAGVALILLRGDRRAPRPPQLSIDRRRPVGAGESQPGDEDARGLHLVPSGPYGPRRAANTISKHQDPLLRRLPSSVRRVRRTKASGRPCAIGGTGGLGRFLPLGPHADDPRHGRGRLVCNDGCHSPSDRSGAPRDAGHAACTPPAMGARSAGSDARPALGRPSRLRRRTRPRRMEGVQLLLGRILDPVERASVLDDSLEILRRLWSGQPVEFEGKRTWVNCTPFLPRPVQDPLPVWVACRWPNRRPLARVARHQGCFPIFDPAGREIPGLPEPEQVAAVREGLLEKGAPSDIEVICRGASGGEPAGGLPSKLAALGQAGMTWWLESFGRGEPPAVEVEAVVAAGPPR